MGDISEPVARHDMPVDGAVTSIHEPVFDERVALPDFTDQTTSFVTPFVMVPKRRRTAPGLTLSPRPG